jgi:CBS-domain-containing membrane protein
MTRRSWSSGELHRHPALRLLWCLVGVACGSALALSIAGPGAAPFLLTSLGGTAVFLFGLTRAPAAQPRAILGGHLGGALIGIACYQMFGDALWVYVLALMLAFAFMLLTRTVHPPAGANPILMVYVHAGWIALWNPVFIGVGCLMLLAAIWSRLYPGLARYPMSILEPSPPSMLWGGWSD